MHHCIVSFLYFTGSIQTVALVAAIFVAILILFAVLACCCFLWYRNKSVAQNDDRYAAALVSAPTRPLVPAYYSSSAYNTRTPASIAGSGYDARGLALANNYNYSRALMPPPTSNMAASNFGYEYDSMMIPGQASPFASQRTGLSAQ